MIKKFNLLFLFSILLFTEVFSQQWDTVANFNSYITCLKSFNNKLFIGGDFTESTNNASDCYWSAFYDGTTLTPHSPVTPGSGIDDFEIFNNELYAASGMVFSPIGQGVVKWDGTTWQFANSIQNINYTDLYADGNDLYATTPNGNVYKKTGNGAFTLFTTAPSGIVRNIIRYQSNLYFCGQFTSIGGVSANHIAKWDGTTFQPLGTGLNFQSNCLAVYNNELYVGGVFSTAGGVNAKSIAKWNGTTWSAVGGSVTGTNLNGIRDMKATTSGLVVVGDFDQIGGVNSNHVSKWNGTTWMNIGLLHEELLIASVEEFNNTIYVGGYNVGAPFKSRLYRYKNNVSVETIGMESNILVLPNPAMSSINISWDHKQVQSIAIKSYLGQLLRKVEINNKQVASMDISDLPAGIFFVEISLPDQVVIKKILKK